MKNPFKPGSPTQDHDDPVVPNVAERPVERAADRAVMHDNPLVPNAIERPVERAVSDGRGASGGPVVGRASVHDRPGDLVHNEPTDRPGVLEHRSDEHRSEVAHGVTAKTTSTGDTSQMDLFPSDELAGFRTRWDAIQTGFVDQPRAAVEQADALVSQVVTRLTELFTRERSTLEEQWTKGDDVSTEGLRLALTRYRSFFHRLLSM